MVILRELSLRRGDRLLLDRARATLQHGERIALIGANGSGKSSLFALLLGELGADGGEVDGLAGLRIAHMAQEVEASALPAREYVLAGDAALAALHNRLQAQEQAGDFDGAAATHAALQDCDGYSAEARVERLLRGLGFAPGDGERPVSAFSGGWRIRLNLARALMTPSDLLLLDEPTNHLDLDASLWLQGWLADYSGTLLLISHDRDFIDASCNRVLHLSGGSLAAYRGGYSEFERQRAERLALEQAQQEKQQQRVAEIEAFVRRFRAKASKARQAQSRLKALERMEQVAAAHVDTPFRFQFPPAPPLTDPALALDRASLGHSERTVLDDVSLRLAPGDRVGLLGRNGAGKSTLLKALVGRLPLLAGERQASDRCRLGYYDQQQLEVLDLTASPAQHLQRATPGAREQAIFDFLGGFDFRGDRATASIAPFSGGEKARLALALVLWQAPNLLVLDEPTNHLDLAMREALAEALQRYDGTVLLVSHDRHLLRSTVDRLWLVADGTVHDYDGDLAGYEAAVLAAAGPAPAPSAPAAPAEDRRSRRQAAAAQRERLRPLQRDVKRLEAALERSSAELAAVQEKLADETLYTAEAGDELTALLRREGELRGENESLEDAWLEAEAALEEAAAIVNDAEGEASPGAASA
ncbi:ABC-F family ATP-binding cassette domain-containing protein [Pseudohaliea rubra]|uniref:Probable ATP-binding protein YheS n=1 Tax=Pseudohaliea rubra DSM 19751 TaxID=1265313 RepID=A0A095XWG1_9GAMM|nr:ATP-binding cassette domain-containing protein [Pseudohaliea rubra]KGE04026.1 Glutathione-regulated potassium-efflux system ATP-binding protein [Pseudohaliea rubra DSM 19751]